MSLLDRLKRLFDTSVDPPPEASDLQDVPSESVPEYVGLTALTIDDSMTILVSLRRTLQKSGFQTLEATTAEDGLKLARTHQPDLIFLDIVLPAMDGFAALRLLRKDPQTQFIPVIMMSGNEQAAEQFYAQRIGANDFMKKPFSANEVMSRTQALVESGQLRSGLPRTLVSAG